MERKKLKKYQMTTGICGPTILHTNIIKAYTPEEAARKYFEEYEEEKPGEITEDKIAEVARRMYEVIDEPPLTKHYDSEGRELTVGDQVFAFISIGFVRGTISKITKRGVKIIVDGKEYVVTVNPNDYKKINGEREPYFSRILKKTTDMAEEDTIAVGVYVVYAKISFNRFEGFGFGFVSRITPSYIYIGNDNEETIRKTPDKVKRLR